MQFEEESPKQYVDIARAPDKEMRPQAGTCACAPSSRPRVTHNHQNAGVRRPVPSGVAARTVVCCVTLLDNIDILPSSGALHTVRPGHNASRAWL